MKKLLTLILVSVMLMSVLAVNVFADATADGVTGTTGDAGIEFIDGEDPGIVDPGDKTPSIKSASIHFGTHSLEAVTKTYDSTDTAIDIPAALRHAGLVVANPLVDYNWKVTASISDFRIGDEVVMNGFELRLSKALVEGDYPQPPEVPATIDKLTSTGGEVLVLNPAQGAYAGTFGVNYAGTLLVRAGTAKEGEASAVMTWSFQAVE